MRLKGSKNKPKYKNIFPNLSVTLEPLDPGTKEEVINQRLDNMEKKLDQLLNGKLIYEK